MRDKDHYQKEILDKEKNEEISSKNLTLDKNGLSEFIKNNLMNLHNVIVGE